MQKKRVARSIRKNNDRRSTHSTQQNTVEDRRETTVGSPVTKRPTFGVRKESQKTSTQIFDMKQPSDPPNDYQERNGRRVKNREKAENEKRRPSSWGGQNLQINALKDQASKKREKPDGAAPYELEIRAGQLWA